MMEQIQYPAQVSRWEVLEIRISGPAGGNPFAEQWLRAEFCGAGETVRADGFYDGGGSYCVRFMPSFTGSYTFTAEASFLAAPLTGTFAVTPAQPGVHGPVRVAETYHFAYEDGTPYYSIGTTCYVWDLQSDERIEQTLESLRAARFNKIRFCIFPKHYAYNFGEPRSYPYEGTPMDSSVLTTDNFMQYMGTAAEGNHWDFFRFNPAHFRHIEMCIRRLAALGIEADLILMHPYDRWGFSCMTPEQNDFYLRYVAARFSAFHNVWWSLANEYDLCRSKTLADWERFAGILVEKDPYHHLRSIHNCFGFYDFSRPWVTHCSVQRVDLYKSSEMTTELRERYRKPVVLDEIAYEGDLQFGWGNLPAQEMVRRFWEAACRGGYPGHGETYRSSDGVIWWSHGGPLRGESWKRFGFLLDILRETPGLGLAPLAMEWDSVCAVPEQERILPRKSYYLFYYSFMQPSFREFHLDDDTDWEAEVIDTWNMTITSAGTFRGRFNVALPSRPYMAIRLRRAGTAR